MTDNNIKKVFEVTLANTVEFLTTKASLTRDRAQTQLLREKYYAEIQQQITSAISDIIVRGRQANATSDFYEKELTSLMTRLNTVIAAIKEDALKMLGSISAYDEALTQAKTLSDIFETELSKAKDLQERQVSGDLDKPRKPGTRPDKLKDVRNYVEDDKDK